MDYKRIQEPFRHLPPHLPQVFKNVEFISSERSNLLSHPGDGLSQCYRLSCFSRLNQVKVVVSWTEENRLHFGRETFHCVPVSNAKCSKQIGKEIRNFLSGFYWVPCERSSIFVKANLQYIIEVQLHVQQHIFIFKLPASNIFPLDRQHHQQRAISCNRRSQKCKVIPSNIQDDRG